MLTQRNLRGTRCDINRSFPPSCLILILVSKYREHCTVTRVIQTAVVQISCYQHPKKAALFCMFCAVLIHILRQFNNSCIRVCLALVKCTNEFLIGCLPPFMGLNIYGG